jgi:small-conductance mechanosensitive channel/CRP-like cAMP-binding protein
VNRPRLKKQLTLPLIASAIFALCLYVVYGISPHATATQTESAPARVLADRMMDTGFWWNVFLAALYISLSFIVVRVVGEFVFFLFRKRKGYDAPNLIRDLFSLVAYVVLIAVILHNVFPSVSFAALLPGSALVGVIIGLALQDTLGNLFAGISLHADKPFQVGDVITVGKWTGVVESISWRAVKIRNFSHHIILVSNSSIAKESIEVCSRDNPNARYVFFNALYTDSPAKVIHVVREAVREVDNVLRYMTPVIRVRNFGESSVEYEAKYWLEDYARYNDTDALVRQRIWYAFRRNKLHFAFPTRTLYLEQRAAGADGASQRDGFTERLGAVDIFSPLTPEELSRLAQNSASHVYAPGEAIIREGEQGASMFVVHRGEVEVQINDKGRTRVVNSLHEGDFFGEMALFTGEPRTANVVAVEETEVLEISHPAVKELFQANPDLVESLTHTIAERRAVLAAKAESKPVDPDEKAGLLAAIKRFFRLD